MIVTSIQEFYQKFKKDMPIMAIDYGKKKSGIALSTPDHKMPMPHSIIEKESDKKKITEILEIISQKNACAIVVGLPINMDGTDSAQTNLVYEFTEKLSRRTNLPIFMQDERLTSKAADSFLQDFGLNRKQRNNSDDLAAASMILETALDSAKKV